MHSRLLTMGKRQHQLAIKILIDPRLANKNLCLFTAAKKIAKRYATIPAIRSMRLFN